MDRGMMTIRQTRIKAMLGNSKFGLSYAQIREKLWDEYGVNPCSRTLKRDIDIITEITGGRTERKLVKGRAIWILHPESDSKTAKISLTNRQMLALSLLQSVSEPLYVHGFRHDLDLAFDLIKSHLDKKDLHFLDESRKYIRSSFRPSLPHATGPELLETLEKACHEEQILSIDYDANTASGRRIRKVGPIMVFTERQKLYLLGVDLESQDKEVKHWRLDRIKEITMVSNEHFTPPKIDIKSWLENSFGVYRGNDVSDVRLTFSSQAGKGVREEMLGGHFPSNAKLEENAKGQFDLAMQVSIGPELEAWIRSFGPDCQIVSPPALGQKLQRAATKVEAEV